MSSLGANEDPVRTATSNDNAALLELARCPMSSDLSLAIERAPDFFALCRARGEGSTFVVESDSRVGACVSIAARPVWLGRTVKEVEYLADLRVAPELRGRGLARRLLAHVAERLHPERLCLFTAAAGNQAVLRVISRGDQRYQVELLARMRSFQLFPLFPLRVPSDLEVGQAGPGDARDIAELSDEFARDRALAPVLGPGGPDAVLSCSPGMTLADWLVARRGGRTVALLSTWDASAVKQTRVLGLPLSLRSFSAVVRGLSHVVPLPQLPLPGETLRMSYVRHAAHAPGEERALSALLRAAVKRARERRQALVLFTCAAGDPLERAAAGIPRATYRYELWGATRRSWIAPSKLGQGAFFHDDAALA